MYNQWFLNFAPKAFRETRQRVTEDVIRVMESTRYLNIIEPELFKKNPKSVQTLRMSMCPPIAVDRLVGLSGASKNLVKRLEEGELPPRLAPEKLSSELESICHLFQKMLDTDIFTWVGVAKKPSDAEVYRASTVVADRLCGAVSNPIIKNAQEKRQLALIDQWLSSKGYKKAQSPPDDPTAFNAGEYSFRTNIRAKQGIDNSVNIPVDVIVKPQKGGSTLLIEAKSAGDFTNTNKRRKEEAVKKQQIDATYPGQTTFLLFLCGYFDCGYLGYEAAEGIDWIWEHRIDDLNFYIP